jgi:hypothetical protein
VEYKGKVPFFAMPAAGFLALISNTAHAAPPQIVLNYFGGSFNVSGNNEILLKF